MSDLDFETIQSAITANAAQDQYGVADTPFHTHNRVDSSPLDYRNMSGRTRFIAYRLLSPTDAVAVANVVGGYFTMPFAGGFGLPNSIGGTVPNPETQTGTIACFASVDTAGTTGTTVVDVKISSPSSATRTSVFLGFKMGIVSGSTSSIFTSQQPTFNIPDFNIGDRLSFDVTAVSSSVPFGLTVYLRVTETSQ